MNSDYNDIDNDASQNLDSGDAEMRDLVYFYALGALDEADHARVAQAVAGNARYRAWLDEARAAVMVLGAATEAATPSPLTKARLFAQVDADLAQAKAQTRNPQRLQPTPVAPMPSRLGLLDRLTNWFRIAAPGLAVACLAVALGMGLVAYSMQRQSLVLQQQVEQMRQDLKGINANLTESQRQLAQAQTELAQAQANLALLNQAGLRTASLPPAPNAPQGAQATLLSSAHGHNAMLIVHGLKPLAADEVYEFWLLKDGQPVPAGTFTVDANGAGHLQIAANEPIGAYQQAGVTIEKAPGSATPNLEALTFIGSIQ